MYYLYHGGDTQKSRGKLHKKMEAALAKNKAAPQYFLDEESFSSEALQELLGGQGLFGGAPIVGIDAVSFDADQKEILANSAKVMAESESIFLILLPDGTKKEIGYFEKYAEGSEESFLPKEANERFNVFALTDALGRRDRKSLWVLYQKAKAAHVADEEIHGILFWQMKCLLLALSTNSAEEAGLKDFPYRKAKGFLKYFKEGEVDQKTKELLGVTYRARRGEGDFGGLLERFILSI